MKMIESGKQNRDVIMLLHGGGLSWWNYRKEAEILSHRFHVVMPILDGHGGSDDDFSSIEDNAARLIYYIDTVFSGHVLLIGGLSLGGQILTEMLSQRADICRYAIIESASVMPSKMTKALVTPSISPSYGLIRRKWFARLQFNYLGMDESYFDDYYRDSVRISKDNMIAFLKASVDYAVKPQLSACLSRVHIIVGERETRQMLESGKLLNDRLPNSQLEIKPGLKHGEYSLNKPLEYVREIIDMLKEHK